MHIHCKNLVLVLLITGCGVHQNSKVNGIITGNSDGGSVARFGNISAIDMPSLPVFPLLVDRILPYNEKLSRNLSQYIYGSNKISSYLADSVCTIYDSPTNASREDIILSLDGDKALYFCRSFFEISSDTERALVLSRDLTHAVIYDRRYNLDCNVHEANEIVDNLVKIYRELLLGDPISAERLRAISRSLALSECPLE